MSQTMTVFLPAGNQLTLVTNAASTATYTQLGAPGEQPGHPISVNASTTVVIGSFDVPYEYSIVSSVIDGTSYSIAPGTSATLTNADIVDGTIDGAAITGATIGTTAITGGTIGGAAISTGTIATAAITDGTMVDTDITVDAVIVSGVGNGAKNGASVTAVELGDGVIHKTILTCTATTITISDDAGVAQYGGVKVYDFPDGLINCHGATITGTLTGGVTGTITDTFVASVALGTVTASTGATLVSTEATFLPQVDQSAAVAKVATIAAYPTPTALTESGGRWVDGTGTAADLYLNFVIADDVTHTAGTATFTGTITFIWSNLGDM